LTDSTRFYCHPKVNGVETISNHNILPTAVKEFFLKKYFCIYEYNELDVETEETMFQLVQRGVALTPAEKMRAMSTEWATFAKKYEDDYPMIVNCEYCTFQLSSSHLTAFQYRSKTEHLASASF
jgi:hypothetical protein